MADLNSSKHLVKASLMILAVVLAIAYKFYFQEEQQEVTQTYHIDQFIAADTCGGCHSDIYAQWENSMHHFSHKDRIYKKASDYFRKGSTTRTKSKKLNLM